MSSYGTTSSLGPTGIPVPTLMPALPDEAVHWLTGTDAQRPGIAVLELNAGVGRLTEQLVRCGHRVIATDPSPQNLAALRTRVVPFAVGVSGAEAIPSPSKTVDVVVCNPASGSLDPAKALAEVNRVLREDGHIAMIWVARDEGVPWVRRLTRLIGPSTDRHPLHDALRETDQFLNPVSTSWRTWQRVNRAELIAYAQASGVTDDGTLAAVGALYDDYDRGPDGLQMPLLVRGLRAHVHHKVVEVLEDPTIPSATEPFEALGFDPDIEPEYAEPVEAVENPGDSGTLLIDFT